MQDANILIHIGYVVALVWFVFRNGRKSGRKELCEEFMEKGLITEAKLMKHYPPPPEIKDDLKTPPKE